MNTPEYLKECIQIDNYHGPFGLLKDWFLIFGSVVISEFAHQTTVWISVPVYIFVCVLIGFRQFGLYSVYHDAIHVVLCRNRWLNDFLGTVFSGWLLFRSLGEHKYKHVNLHHTKLLTSVDPAIELYDSIGLPRIHDIFLNSTEQKTNEKPKSLDSYYSEINSILIRYFLNPIYGLLYVLEEVTESSIHETKTEKALRLTYTSLLLFTLILDSY